MQELGGALHAEGLTLTVAVSATQPTIDAAYNVPALAEAVDFIHLMSYDFHGAWESFTHHQSILYAYPGVRKYSHICIEFRMQMSFLL